MPIQLLQVRLDTLHMVGTYVKNTEDEHWETFDKMPVVQIRLQSELSLQQLPRAAAFVF